MKKKSILSLLLALAMVLALMAGCGTTENTAKEPASEPAPATSDSVQEAAPPTEEAPAPEAEASAEDATEPAPAEEYGECAISFPLDETETLTYWHDVDSRILTYIPSGVIDDAPAFIAAEEATNVHIEHVGVGMDAESDQFNLMVASGDYTDLIKKATDLYSKGSIAAMDDEVIIDLSPYLEEYAPDFLRALDLVEGYENEVTTDDGRVPTFVTVYAAGMVYWNLNQFVDYEKNHCDFQSADFKDLLELAKRLPASLDADDDSADTADAAPAGDEMQRLQSGDVLMTSGYIYRDDLKEMYSLYHREHGIVRIGYPTETSNGAMLHISGALAISAQCKDQSGAWAFIKSVLSDDFQKNLYEFPVSKKIFEQVLQSAMERDSYTDEDGNVAYAEEFAYIGDTEYTLEPLTEEQAADFRAYVDGASIAGNYDINILNIISGEASAYFAGDKTADAVAELIQNRVNIYLGEIN